MVILTILLAILLTLLVIATIAILAGGVSVIVAFGDIIAFVLIVWLLVKLFRRRRGS